MKIDKLKLYANMLLKILIFIKTTEPLLVNIDKTKGEDNGEFKNVIIYVNKVLNSKIYENIVNWRKNNFVTKVCRKHEVVNKISCMGNKAANIMNTCLFTSSIFTIKKVVCGTTR